MVNNGEASQAKQKQRWRSRANYSLTMAQPSPTQNQAKQWLHRSTTTPNDGVAECPERPAS